jgi:hypothetical protein
LYKKRKCNSKSVLTTLKGNAKKAGVDRSAKVWLSLQGYLIKTIPKTSNLHNPSRKEPEEVTV